MKVGIFDPYLDDLGGGEKYMMTLAECLSKEHQVFVFWDNKEEVKELLQRFLIDLSDIIFTKNIFSPKVNVIERTLATRKFDVIIVLSDGSIPFVFSKKVFIHFQQPIKLSLSVKDKFKLRRIAGIFCNSYYTKSFIDKTFNVNSHVIYPPVDYYPKRVNKENIILTVGRFRARSVDEKRIVDYKKQGVLVDVFKELIDKGLKNWHFVIAVGVKEDDEDKFDEFKKKTEGYPITFFINKTNDELWNLYNKAKIYWHASGFGEDLEKHPEYAEHFGISTVEAMGAGAVPIVFNAGGQKEIVRDRKNGLLWNTLQELEDKTLWAIEDTALWQRLSESAKLSSRAYSKERFYRELNEILKS